MIASFASSSCLRSHFVISLLLTIFSYDLWGDLTDHILLKVDSGLQTVLFVQRIIATFSHVSLETKYSTVCVINYTIIRG